MKAAKLIQRTLDPAVSAEWLTQKSAAWKEGQLVMERDGEPHSFLISESDGKTARILKLGVAPEARGKGHAKTLLRDFDRICRQSGIERIELEVRASNAAARRLYLSDGFAETETLPGFYPDGETGIRMAKILTLAKAATFAATFAGPVSILKALGDGMYEGYASWEMVDVQGDLIDMAAFQAAATAYVEIGAPMMRVHNPIPVGNIREINFEPPAAPKAIRVKFYVTDKTSDGKETREGIESGKYRGLSIGGRVHAQHRECSLKAEGCYNRITRIDWFETSVVETPANPGALITSMVKSMRETHDHALLTSQMELHNLGAPSPSVAEGPLKCDCDSLTVAQKAAIKVLLQKADHCPECGKKMEDGKCPDHGAMKTSDSKARDAAGGAPPTGKKEGIPMSDEKIDALAKAQAETNTILKSLVEKLTPPAAVVPPPAPAPTPKEDELQKALDAMKAEIASLKSKTEAEGSRAPPAAEGEPKKTEANDVAKMFREASKRVSGIDRSASAKRVEFFRKMGVPETELYPYRVGPGNSALKKGGA